MISAPIPDNDPERLASLRNMLLVATPDEESFDRITRTARRIFNTPIVLISLIDQNRQWFKSCIGLNLRETGRDVSFCGHAILYDDLFVIENALEDERFADNPLVTGEPRVVFYAGRPLRNHEGFNIGTLCLIDHQPRTFTEEDRQALDDLGYWVEAVFQVRNLGETQQLMLQELDETRRTSMLDPMLNIWNRKAFMLALEKETLRAFRNKSPVAVLMIDVDNFKTINDTYGHPAGDAILIEFIRRLHSVTRVYDTLGRYGGDEFMVVLPDTALEAAQEIAARLVRVIDMGPFQTATDVLSVSVSVGLATADFVKQTPEPQVLLHWADEALLEAKRAGRNQVVVWSDKT